MMLVLCPLLGVLSAPPPPPPPSPFDPPLMLWDGPQLLKGRAQIAAGSASASLRATVTKLNATAYQSLPEYDPGPLRPRYYSVMNKSSIPPSGDKHDFLVYASYYWPCNAVCGKDAPPPPGDHCERFFENACRSQGDHCNAKTNPKGASCSFSNCSGMCGAPDGLCPDFCNNGSMWLHAPAGYSWCRRESATYLRLSALLFPLCCCALVWHLDLTAWDLPQRATTSATRQASPSANPGPGTTDTTGPELRSTGSRSTVYGRT
jgi:hypothetical protein